MQSEKINEIATALSKAQGEFKPIKKDSSSFKGRYADLATIMDAVRSAMAKYELALTCCIEPNDVLTAKLIHSSGQWIATCTNLKPKSDLHQDFGAAITYKRRYLITSILGIAPYDETDDDGARDFRQPKLPATTIISLDKAKTLNDKFIGYDKQVKQIILNSLNIKDFSELTTANYQTAIDKTKKVLNKVNSQ